MVTCPECGRDFKSQSALSGHVNREHASDPLAALRASVPGSPRPGGVVSSRPLVAMPSGVPSVDYAIGIGGVPRGAIVEVFGPSQTGKTFVALTFSAYQQQQGGRGGFMDAECALQTTFLKLIPGLDIDALEYGMPPDGHREADPKVREKMLKDGWDGSGEAALEASRRFINSGQFDVWTVDSVHALTPRAVLDLPIGHPSANAAIARLMSSACQIMEHEIERTKTLCIFVNHIKEVPQARFGRDWSKPGGSALDYYAAVQLHITGGEPFYRAGDNRKIGHEVKVRVHKSKVAAPHAKASFDLYWAEGPIKETKTRPARYATPGVDVESSWFSILDEADVIGWSGNRYVALESGEAIGSRQDVIEALRDPESELRKTGHELVYPAKYQKVA
jgi:recombination protein RecA